MNLVSVSSLAWLNHKKTVNRMIYNFTDKEKIKDDFIILDLKTIERINKEESELNQESIQDSCMSVNSHKIYKIEDWLKKGISRYEIDDILLKKDVIMCDKFLPFYLDIGGLSQDDLGRILLNIRKAFFMIHEWPPVLVLIVDDSHIVNVSDVLFNAFFIQPISLTEFEVIKKVKRIQRKAFVGRIFGLKGTLIQKMFDKFWGFVDYFTNAKIYKNIDTVNKWKHQSHDNK